MYKHQQQFGIECPVFSFIPGFNQTFSIEHFNKAG